MIDRVYAPRTGAAKASGTMTSDDGRAFRPGADAAPPLRALGFARLKARHRAERAGFPEPFSVRVHRTLSWLSRAEREADDPDSRFLFLWIAFNAAYGGERDAAGERPREREALATFLGKLVGLDRERRLHACVTDRFSGQVRLLLDNPYVFGPFWSFQNGVPGYADWRHKFEGGLRVHAVARAGGDTARILSLLFDRLYVLRNQLIHGGATWNSGVNREQVDDGAEILGALVPITADLMMDNPDEDWGQPFYPVVDADG